MGQGEQKKTQIMKKNLFNWIAMMMMVIVCVGFASCSKGGDSEGEGVSIVGEWVDNNTTLVFKKDGSYYRSSGANDPTPQSGTYSYNPAQSTLVVNVKATDWNNAYQRTYVVQTLTATTLVLMYTDGDVMGYFTRKESQKSDKSGSFQGHDYIDLGLPSGTLWATCNIGASKPEDYGDYFAWGETQPKSNYDWSTYKWCNGSESTMTKYCTDSNYGTVDNRTELERADDAATVRWGAGWQMPSHDQFEELINNSYTITTWTNLNDVDGGVKITSRSNGKSIFLIAAGYRNDGLQHAGFDGRYWSRSLSEFDSYGEVLSFGENLDGTVGIAAYYDADRDEGLPIRPVRRK